MQKLTIKTMYDNQGESLHRIAKYNIGQKVYVLDWTTQKPIVLEGCVLFIGVDHPLQSDNFMYIIDRHIRNDDLKKFYEHEVFPTMIKASKHLLKLIKKESLRIKEIINHPYYQGK